MKNWKTTLGGILVASGTAMQANDDANIKLAGIIIGTIGGLILGFGGKDNNVTGGTVQQNIGGGGVQNPK